MGLIMATDNYNHIKQTFEQVLLKQDLSNSFYQIVNLKNELQNFLIEFNEVTELLTATVENSVNLVEGQKTVSQTTKRYRAVKKLQQDGYKLDEKLKQGYIYIDEIREALTGQHITYQVGFIDDNTFVQGEMDLLEILNNSNLDVETKGRISNAAKLRITKTPDLSQITNIYEEQIKQHTEKASSVFSAVYNYLTNTRGQTPKVNYGNAYQVYKYIVNQREKGNIIPPPVTVEEIEDVYAMVKRNNVAFYRGGDIADIQVKYFGGSAPSLVTTATIKRVLNNTIKMFDIILKNSGPNQKVINGFVKLFTVKEKQVYTEAEKIALKKAQKIIEERLNNIKIQIPYSAI